KKKNVLEFIHLKVFLPHSDYPRMVDVSPDILVSQLLQVLGDRYGLDVIEHSLMIVIDGEKVAIPEQLKYKPLYVCDLECVAIVPNKMHDGKRVVLNFLISCKIGFCWMLRIQIWEECLKILIRNMWNIECLRFQNLVLELLRNWELMGHKFISTQEKL